MNECDKLRVIQVIFRGLDLDSRHMRVGEWQPKEGPLHCGPETLELPPQGHLIPFAGEDFCYTWLYVLAVLPDCALRLYVFIALIKYFTYKF